MDLYCRITYEGRRVKEYFINNNVIQLVQNVNYQHFIKKRNNIKEQKKKNTSKYYCETEGQQTEAKQD